MLINGYGDDANAMWNVMGMRMYEDGDCCYWLQDGVDWYWVRFSIYDWGILW